MYCSECGMPKGVGKANTWMSSGAIVSKYEAGLRGIFCDVECLNSLFSSLSGRIGYDVTRLVIEGKRKDSKHYTRGLLRSIQESGATLPGPEEFFQIMAANYSIPGFGRVNIVSYREGEGIVLEMEDTYSVSMAQGQAAGVFEAVLNCRGDVAWEGDARRGRVTVTAREGEPELERRIESEVEHAVPLSESGDRKYELCSRCHIPLELSREFVWDAEKALIIERRSGRRFIFDNTRGIVAVMRVLVDELGEDVEQTLVEISRADTHEYYRGLKDASSCEEEFLRLSLWGWGYPTGLREQGGGYMLQVINPFYDPIMVGRVWGLVESLSGKILDLTTRDFSGGISYLGFSPA